MPKLIWFVLFMYFGIGLQAQQSEVFQSRLDALKKANNYSEYIYVSLDEFAKFSEIDNLIVLENISKNLWRKPLNQNEFLAQIYFNVNYGYYLKQFGFISESVFYYEKAKEIFEQHPSINYDIIEFCYKPLANNYTRLGDFERAEDLLKVTLSKAQQNNDEINVLAAYSNLAIIKRSLGEFNKAIEYLNLALEKTTSQSFSGKVYSDLAMNYLLLNDLLNAEKMLKLSNSLANEPKVLSKNIQTQGNIYLLKSDFIKAKMNFEKALPLAKEIFGPNDREVGKLYNQIAQCNMGLGWYNEAIFYYELSLKTLIPKYSKLGIEDNFDENYLYPENKLLESFDGLAEAYTFLNKWDKALANYNLSFLVESQLQQTYTTQQAKLIQQQQNRKRSELCIKICYDLYEESKDIEWVEKAFIYAENSKSSVLNDVKKTKFNKSFFSKDSIFINEKRLLFQKAELNKKIVIEELKRENASINLLAEYTKDRDQTSNKLQLLKQEIRKKYPYINQSSNTISSSIIQSEILKENQTFVEFFNGEQHIFRFVIPKNNVITLNKIEKTPDFETTIEVFLNLFVTGNRAAIQNNLEHYSTLGFKLYTFLFSELESKSLIIVPDGQLSFIPFDALLTKKTSLFNFEKLPYFVKNTELQLAYSASLLNLNKEKPETKISKVLGFFPIFENKNRGLATLSYTKEELKSIKSNWDGDYFEDKTALMSTFKNKSEEAHIIHLSTHASAGDFTTPPSVEFFDKTLYLPEIYGYNFSADLLVLSACETGLGVLRKGEGAMSLARGFSYAGVKNLIVSLWKVNDKSTQELMSGFYRNLKDSNDKSGALHNSKLDYLNNSEISSLKKSPYYWAGFTYIGENSIPKKSEFQFWWLLIPLFLLGGFFLLKKR